jgi:O-antigen ligase
LEYSSGKSKAKIVKGHFERDVIGGGYARSAINSSVIRGIGQLTAYLAVPASLGFRLPGGAVVPDQAMLVSIYVLSLLGIVAVFRGAHVRQSILRGGYLFLACYAMLLVTEYINSDIYNRVRPDRYDFWEVYHLLLLLPFFAIALREVGCDLRRFEYAMMVTSVLAAGWAVIQFQYLGIARPEGVASGSPSTFGLVALTWSLALFSAALRSASIEWVRLTFALVGLIAVVLSGSKLVWGCATLGYSVVAVWWVWKWGKWQLFLLGATLALAVAFVTLRIFEHRLSAFSSEMSSFFETGDTSGPTFGIRYSMAVSGLLAFLEKPFFGHGLADVMAAASAHRPSNFNMFTHKSHLHNDYVTHLVAFGLPGLVFLISLFGALVHVTGRSADIAMKRFGIAMISALLLFAMAEDVFAVEQKFALIALLFGLLSLSDDGAGHEQTGYPKECGPLRKAG